MKHVFPVAVLLTALLAATAAAENWPQWRGPNNDGVSSETNLPTEWSESKNIVWKLPLPGQAGATPIIWNDRIFVSSADDKDLVLMCIGADGKLIWKKKLSEVGKSPRGGEGNAASPTPRN